MSSTPGIEARRTWLTGGVLLSALVGLLVGAYYAGAELRLYDWDPVGVVSVGEKDPVRREYAENLFDREIPLIGDLGHDGRFFIIQAMDPLFLDVEQHGQYLDRPTYRAQRMLYPTLASLARPFAGPQGVAWAMVGLNVLAFALGTAATAVVARQYSLSAWWGLAFALNPGVRFELDIDGGGAIAFALVMVGVALARRRETWPMVAALTAAVLAREVTLICAFGLALARGVGSPQRRLSIAGVPALSAAAWWAYVQARLGEVSDAQAVQELGLPFKGFLGALDLWIQEGELALLIGPFYMFLALIMIVRALRRWSILEMPAVGFAVVGLLLTRPVWFQYFDISRALIPLPTFFGLSLAASLFGRPPAIDSGAPGNVDSPVGAPS
jgi:hypothetical protein